MRRIFVSMKENLNRRDFTWRTSSGVCGLLNGALLGSGRSADQERDPSEKRLVLLGLNALARAHEMKYFADGHRGASLVSAHLMCVDNGLDEQATARITELFDLNWAKKPLCQPFPEAEPDPSQVDKIGLALADGKGVLREVGHDAIFAMLAIKGFRLLPSAATPQRIEGVCKLIRAIKPWRDVKPAPDIDPPPFDDTAAASEFVLREANAAMDRFIGFGQGFTGHMLTFGQALIELAAMGDVEWAESCRTAFRKYVTVTRKGPDSDARRIKDHKFSKLRPDAAEYWQKRGEKTVGIGHVFKYPYAYYDLLARAKNPELAKEFDAKAWQLF
jgi:hypothetical protein